MIIDENGEIISKKDELNTRHRWTNWSPSQQICEKCGCIKTRISKLEQTYTIDNETKTSAGKCDNRLLIIIKNEKNEKRKEGEQLYLF